MLREDHRAAPAPDPEALIAEARRRQRRRWFGVLAAIVVAGGFVASGAAIFGHSHLTRFFGAASSPAAGPSLHDPALVGVVYNLRTCPCGGYSGNPAGPSWIWLADASGGHPMRLIQGLAPVLSPDGRWVAYFPSRGAGWSPGAARVISTGGGAAHPLIRTAPELRDATGLEWAPDSRHLLQFNGSMFVVDRLTGSEAKVNRSACPSSRGPALGRGLVVKPNSIQTASFSPNSRSLVFGCGGDLFTYSVATGAVRQLTDASVDGVAVWGPSWIAFARGYRLFPGSHARGWNIWLVRPNGTGAHQLTDTGDLHPIDGLSPLAWSSDGSRLIAERGRACCSGRKYAHMWAVDAETGVARELAPGFVAIGLSRDGNTILATRDDCVLAGEPSGVEAVPIDGSAPHQLLDGACTASWNV